jgi:inosose dehydratase
VTPAGISTALYGWTERYQRDGVEWDWARLYGDCAAAGVDAVETDPSPEKLAILTDLGLRVSASYVGLPLTLPFGRLAVEDSLLPIAERLSAAGGRDLLLNADLVDWSKPVQKSDDDARRQGENLSRIAELVAPLGLSVALHNHAADPHNAEQDLRSVLLHSDAAVRLCLDIGWAHVAGSDPVGIVRAHAERVQAFHLRNQRGAVPTEDLLIGEIDIRALLDAAPGYSGWLTLELWHPDTMRPERSMLEDTRRSVEHLRALLAEPGADQVRGE